MFIPTHSLFSKENSLMLIGLVEDPLHKLDVAQSLLHAMAKGSTVPVCCDKMHVS